MFCVSDSCCIVCDDDDDENRTFGFEDVLRLFYRYDGARIPNVSMV